MPQRPPRRSGNIPSPYDVAARFAQVTGQAPVLPPDNATNVRSGYYITGDRADRVSAVFRWGPRVEMESQVPIGHYDPASDSWRFPREYIRIGEAAALAAHIRAEVPAVREMLIAEGRAGALRRDVHDPYSRWARRELAIALRPLGMAEFLARPAVREMLAHSPPEESAVVDADEYTYVFPTLASRVDPLFAQEKVGAGDTITTALPLGVLERSQVLALCVAGLRVMDSDGLDGTERSARHVIVADRSTDDPTVWIPNTDIVTMKDWEIFGPVPGMLERAAADYPQAVTPSPAQPYSRAFSVFHACVVYNSTM